MTGRHRVKLLMVGLGCCAVAVALVEMASDSEGRVDLYAGLVAGYSFLAGVVVIIVTTFFDR
jgi:hypothetical protein